VARDKSVFDNLPQGGQVTADEPPRGIQHASEDRSFFGHPKGLSTLFFTEMWERMAYYGIRPLLVLFMTAAMIDGGFGFDRTTASSIVGIYAACVYLASLPGGWVADRLLGLRRAIWYGAILISAGQVAVSASIFMHLGRPAFFVGLILIVFGTGLLKPNVSAIVGDLYPEGGSRRDAGFSIFYMGINVGALIAPLVTGYLGEKVGWGWGFGAGGIAMIIGLVQYRLRAGPTLGEIGTTASGTPEQKRVVKITIGIFVAIVAALALAGILGMLHINAVAVAKNMTMVMLGMALLYFIYLFVGGGLTGDEKKRIAVIIVLFLFATIFWAAFEQAPTSLNLFARDYTNRVIFGWQMPTLWLQSVNSVFVIVLAPVFAWLWTSLGNRNRDPSSPAKFAFGLLFAGLGFLIMVPAAKHIIAAGGHVVVSPWWLVASYFLQTIGELSLSPVGLSSMTKLAPRAFVGQMMGVWFMAAAIGNLLAGLVGGQVNPENLAEMPALFLRTSMSLFISCVVLALLIVPIRRMMENVPGKH
jgi:POT family proton-dependent oligopeptide transporter